MGWWSDIRDSVFSPVNGTAIGNALGQTWAYNYNQRGIDKATDAIKKYQEDLLNQRAAQYRQAAENTLNAQYGINDYVGVTPQQGLLNAKKKWWQAQNDAQYLLNNGYDENSADVQKFRNEQAAAHEMAENFRKLGQAKNIDMANVGQDVNSLQAAKAAISTEQSPYYQFGDYQLAKNALDMSYKRPPSKEEIAQAALKVNGLQFMPTQAELQEVYANGKATPGDVAPPDGKQVANEMAGGAPPQQPPAQPNQMQSVGNADKFSSQAPQQSPYPFSVDDVRKAANDLKNNPNTITTQDIYNTFGIDYDKLVGDKAKQVAQADLANEQKSPDYRENLRRSLIKSGLPAGQVEAALQKIDKREAEQKKKMAQAAIVASLKDNPQSAALVNYALMSGADVKDIVNAFEKSSSDYTFDTMDTGQIKYGIRYDKKGRGAGSMQPFNVTASPNNLLSAKVAERGQNLNYAGKQMDNQTKLKVANLNGQYGLAKAQINGQNKNKGQSAGDPTVNMTNSQRETYNEILNLYHTAHELATSDDKEESGNAVDNFCTAANEALSKGKIPPESRTSLENMMNQVQFMREKKWYPGGENTQRYWANMTDDFKKKNMSEY